MLIVQADIRRALDIVDEASDSWTLKYTNFFTPPTIADILANTKKLSDVTAFPWGGFSQAERQRLIIGREELVEAARLNLDEVSLFHPLKDKTGI